MSQIKFENVGLKYGEKVVTEGMNFEIQQGEIFVLVGPSGGGKTSTLKMINALVIPTDGYVYFEDKKIRDYDLQQLRLKIGYVLQQIALFPNMTVKQNIELIPELIGWDKEKCRERSQALLDKVGLPAEKYAGRFPRELSGGEQQRIGILRAIAAEPDLILMDEPFSALDPISRTALQDLILDIHAEFGTTIVFVTHDMNEAMKLGDRIAVVADGEIAQLGTPDELKNHPATDFVKSFFGAANFDQLTLKSLIEELELDREADPVWNKADVTAPIEQVYQELSQNESLAIYEGENFLGNIDRATVFRILAKK
ncbi:ABC transporter ATP-binding protein [Lactococcus termiticola]|uniref:ABC-type quaternary amine transporter n=1 Tax=Lactococcus termiticola TaxID=2169526 RepID=A0A2R5HFL6_9LACT|nr:ABC transporter ATP-binding protein [Lactococcus termiticola]GBG96863.1 glycine betaine/carnitine/choline ABC transporter ATP-binding protein [Lactococcus termiticola]